MLLGFYVTDWQKNDSFAHLQADIFGYFMQKTSS